MELALLGSDYDTIALATAAHNLGHAIVWTGDVGGAIQEYQLPWLTEQDQHDQWESLLDNGFCDAVLVGRGEIAPAMRQEQLNQLMKNGIATLTSFPVLDSVLAYYEIDMVRAETGALLRHYNPLAQFGGASGSSLLSGREHVGRMIRHGAPRPAGPGPRRPARCARLRGRGSHLLGTERATDW